MNRSLIWAAVTTAALASFLFLGCGVVEFSSAHPAMPQPAPISNLAFGYVESTQTGTVSQFQISPSGLWKSLAPTEVSTGNYPESLIVDPSGHFVYVANADDNTISEYTISAETGTLKPTQPATVTTGAVPQWLVCDPLGNFVYIANTNDSTISEFSIDHATGKLTQVATVPFVTSSGQGSPTGLIVDPLNRFVYAVGGSTVDVYTVNRSTGRLSNASQQNATIGSDNFPPAIDPSGTFLYVPAPGLNAVEVAAIDPTTGAITPATIPSVPVEDGASSVAIDPTGRFLYVVNRASQSISQFTVSAGGGLMPMSIPVVQDPGEPWQIVVDPSGQLAYVSNEQTASVTIYRIGGGGNLTYYSSAPAGVGAGGIGTASPQ
jgi:6-phosphogluconolactonase